MNNIHNFVDSPTCSDLNKRWKTVSSSKSFIEEYLFISAEKYHSVRKSCYANKARDITTDYNDFFGKVPNKFYLYYCGFVQILNSLLVLKTNISKQIFKSIFKNTLLLSLAFLKFPLLIQSFYFIDCNLPLTMTTYNEETLVFVQTFYIETCHRISFHCFINKCFDFLFALIKQSNRTITTTDCDEVFYCCYTVKHTLWNINVPVEPISDLFE